MLKSFFQTIESLLQAVITSTEMPLFELLRDAKHPKFRELSKLIK